MTLRVAALSDIHGNLPALEAVLREVEQERPDLIVFGGDVASGPMPAETIELLRALEGARFVRGNADRGLIDEFDGKAPAALPGPFSGWCAAQLNRDQRDFLASFEERVEVEDIVVCHASLRNDVDVFTRETPDDRVRLLMAGASNGMVVCGHTHMQFDRRVGDIRVVNPGSVGMPYGEPGAYWAIVGDDVDMRRTDYDRKAAAARIRDKHSDVAEKFAAENVLTVPSVEEAMTFLRRLEAEQVAAQT